MTDNDEYEVHPLDRDYSSDQQTKPTEKSWHATEMPYDNGVRKAGVMILIGGLILVFLTAIAISNLRGNTSAETLAGVVNRIGMVVMLVGAITIVVAYRLGQIKRLAGFSQKIDISGQYSSLVVWNVVGFLVSSVAIFLTPSVIGSGVTVAVLKFFCTLFFCMMVTIGIWHRGFMRAYGIAAATATFFTVYFGGWFTFTGRTGGDFRAMLLVNVAIILMSAVICSGYVLKLESITKPAGDRSRD